MLNCAIEKIKSIRSAFHPFLQNFNTATHKLLNIYSADTSDSFDIENAEHGNTCLLMESSNQVVLSVYFPYGLQSDVE